MKRSKMAAITLWLFLTFVCFIQPVRAQSVDTLSLKQTVVESLKHREPPVPVELVTGNRQLYYQTTLKRNFSPASRFSFFSLATFSSNYNNKLSENRMLIEGQVSYTLKNGFGIMTGVDINSVTGFAPIAGPQHTYASKKILAVTILSFFINSSNDVKLFGLYEYRPALNNKWSLYNRVQFIYNYSIAKSSHNRSYLYLRSGFKIYQFVFGLGANLDKFGPDKEFKENIGPFFRWEFN